MKQEPKTFQLVTLINFFPVISDLIFKIFPIFKWKLRSEMQALWDGTQPASKSPKECHRCVRQGGEWERRSKITSGEVQVARSKSLSWRLAKMLVLVPFLLPERFCIRLPGIQISTPLLFQKSPVPASPCLVNEGAISSDSPTGTSCNSYFHWRSLCHALIQFHPT